MLTVKIFTFNPLQENSYILYNEEKTCCVIDPGCYFDHEKKDLQIFIEREQLVPKNLLNTHCHLDHVFGNSFVSDTWRLPLQIHKREELVLSYAPIFGNQWNLPVEAFEGELSFLQEGHRVTIGDDELEVLFTPGHSPGHVCFYSREQQFVIGGDVLFRESIGRTDLPGGNFQTLIRSIEEKLFVLPDEVVVYPGHGEPTTIGYEKQNNPFLKGNLRTM